MILIHLLAYSNSFIHSFIVNPRCHQPQVAPKCSYITPVPGGVGPMTISLLMKNTLNLARHSLGLERITIRKSPSYVNVQGAAKKPPVNV